MKEYFVTRGGVELVVKLRPETAKRVKARPVEAAGDEPKGRAPRNKSRAPANK